MMADSLLVYTIIVLVVGYSQLVVSQICELETLLSAVNKLGTDSSHPAKSCKDIYTNNMASRGQSGYYWIKTDDEYRVYCDMELTCGGITGGWMTLILIKEMTVLLDGRTLHNQSHYVEDQVMLLDVTLLLHTLLMHHILMVFP